MPVHKSVDKPVHNAVHKKIQVTLCTGYAQFYEQKV